MSLLDAINDRISQLQAATDANYKAAGYEVPTSAQRKAAELTGQNPYEYATQLKQIETAQKEAEKAAKAAQKQAAKAARQSSSRSSSGSSRKSSKSSKSSSAESKSVPSGNTGAMSSLLGSESETIPSIKDSEQTKQEAAKAWASSRKKDTASKLVQASTAALQGVKFGNKKSENNVKSTSTTSTPKAEESSSKATSASNKSKTKNQNTKTSGGKKTVATQLAQVSVQALKGVKPKASDNTSQTETIPKYDPFPQGSMPKTLYDIRNAEMADLKVQQDKVDEVNQLVNQYRQEAAAKGVDLDAELAKMNDYTGENKSIEELAVELDMEKHPEKYSQDSSAQKPQSVKIDSTNVKDYLDPDRYLEDYEVEAAKAYIDEYKKTHEGFEDTVTLYNDAPNQVARYNRENGTNYSLRDYLTANGISMDEYQEALSVQALEQKLSNAGAFASGFTRKESNMANLPDRIGNLITGGAISRGKADIERNATEAEKAAMFYSDLEKSRREKTTKGQETQNPLAYGAGSLTRMTYDTALTKGIGDALLEGVNIPALNSSNPVVKNLAEIGLDTALVDIPTDTIPEIIENYNNGMPMDEIVEKAGWNIAGNVGINALMDWAIPSYISNMGKEATQQAEKEAAQYAENLGISTPFDLSNENINALIPSINNADNLSRQLQDSLNNQIEEPIRNVTDIPGAEPITVSQDIEGLQNQWDDYLKDISNETPGSLEVRAPKLDDYLQRTYENYMDDLAKAASTEDIVEIMQKATLDFRAGSLSEDQFQNLIKVAQGDAAVDTAAGVVGDTVASNVMRTGLDTIHPEHGVSVGEMVTQLTDDMRTSVDDFGTKYADLLNKNETIRTKYENLSKAVDDFNNAALHTDENLDDYYRKIDATRKNLQRNLKKVDEGASKDVIFSNSKNGVIKRADQARYHIKNDITINDPNEAMDWLPGFEGMTRSEMEDSAKDLFAEEAPRNIPIQGTTAKMTYEDYINSLNKSNNVYVTDDIFKNAYQSYKSGDLNADDLRRLVAKENYADPSHKISDGEFVESLWDHTSQAWPEALRKGMDTIDPNTNKTIGEVVQGLADDIKASEEAIRELYPKSSFDLNALSLEVGHFTHDALLTDKNLDRSYEIIESYLDNLQAAKSWDSIKLDKAEAELFSNYRNNILEKADQVRNYVNSIDTADTAARNIPNGTTSSPMPQASGGSNVPGANRLQFFGDGKADSKDWRTRGFRTNTVESMGWGDALPEEDYAYKVLHTDTQHKIAEERYRGSESVMNDLLNKNYDSFDAPDIKAGMTEIQSLIDNGDNISANRLAKRVGYEGTNAGQVAQAFKEYNKNTSAGALTEAYMTQNERVIKPWKSRNKKAVEGNSRIASALAKMGDDTKTVTGSTVQLTHDQVKKGVIAELEKEYGSIEKTFSNADIEFLTEMAEDKSIPVWQITSEIEHKFNTGDWYTLDESIELPKPQNQKLQTALNDLVNKEVRKEAPPKTLNQIKAEVQNTLDSNSSSFSGNFTDSDVDYLANLINQGASKQELEEALNTKLATGTFGISEETQQAVNDLFKQASMYDENSKQFVDLQMEAYRRLANEIAPNATALEKFDSWRYLAMLGNPKTMLRNTVGNMTFNLVTSFSNSVAALGEAGVDKIVRGLGGDGIQRTKALLGTGDTDLIKSSWLDANNSRFRQLTGAKYEKFNDNSILGARSTFNSKPMQAYEKFVDWGINDYPAARTKYSTSLAGYLKANGYDSSIFEAEVKLDRLKNLSEQRLLTDAEQASVEQLTKDVNALEKARDYAVKQAEYATFHEDNKIANVLSEWSRASKERGTGIGSKVIEGTVPFKRTPANVLRSGLEYSPLGAIDSIRKTGKLIYENTGKRAGNLAETYLNKKGKEVTKTLAADVIDSWSKTLTGVGLVGLGAYLYDKDILKVSDKDLKYQDQLEGIQNYSIKINGHTYTIDWAAPSAIPLFLGAELAKIWPATGKDTENLYDNLDGYLAAFTRMADPIVETSMLSGVRDTLTNAATAVQNNDNMDMITSILAGTLTGYATQAIPTFSGQLARTIDNTRRSTYTDKEGAAGAIDRQLKKTMNKIPGLSFLNEPYVDTYGRQQQNSPFGNPIANFAYQALSPGYLADVNTTAADTLSRNMYDIDQDTKMLPAFKSSVKVDGERVSPEDYTRYAKTYGQANYEIRTALANDKWFNSLTPTEQKAIVEGINNVANKVGMAEIDPDFESDDGAYNAYKEFGMDGLLDYYKEATEKNHVKNVAKEAGADKKFSVTDTVLKAYEEGITVKGQTVKGDDAVTMYTQAAMYLKENGMDNNEKNRQMYYDNQLTELQERKTVTDAASKYDMEYSAQNAEVLDTYGEEGLEAKSSLLAAGYSFGDPEKKLYAEGGLPAIQGYIDDLNALGSAGLKTTYTTYSGYQDANNTIPGGITPTQYANAVKAMDTNNNSTVNQSEFLDYVNSNNFSEEEVKLLWNAFGEWKTEPYIKADGTWGARRVK